MDIGFNKLVPLLLCRFIKWNRSSYSVSNLLEADAAAAAGEAAAEGMTAEGDKAAGATAEAEKAIKGDLESSDKAGEKFWWARQQYQGHTIHTNNRTKVFQGILYKRGHLFYKGKGKVEVL